jgi:hypothetical protein
MPKGLVNAAKASVRGIRTEFKDAHRESYNNMASLWGRIARLGLSSDKFEETYGYYEGAPRFTRQARGESITTSSFSAENFDVVNYAYSNGVKWHSDDELFDQLGGLREKAREAGQGIPALMDRIFIQMITAATDTDLLPAVPNDPTGAALYANSRTGYTFDNLISGSGVANSSQIITDIFNGMETAIGWLGTNSEPLNDAMDLTEMVILHAPANLQVFNEAIKQVRRADANNTAVTNIISDSELSVSNFAHPRLSGNDWYVFFPRVQQKALFQQEVQGLQIFEQTQQNSTEGRENQIVGLLFRALMGFGIGLPRDTFKVDN